MSGDDFHEPDSDTDIPPEDRQAIEASLSGVDQRGIETAVHARYATKLAKDAHRRMDRQDERIDQQFDQLRQSHIQLTHHTDQLVQGVSTLGTKVTELTEATRKNTTHIGTLKEFKAETVGRTESERVWRERFNKWIFGLVSLIAGSAVTFGFTYCDFKRTTTPKPTIDKPTTP